MTTTTDAEPYAFLRGLAREQNRRDAEAVEARGVVLMKSALRMPGLYGGLAGALQIAHETADELVTLDRRHAAYAEHDTPDEFADALALVQQPGGWVPAVPEQVTT